MDGPPQAERISHAPKDQQQAAAFLRSGKALVCLYTLVSQTYELLPGLLPEG